MCFLGVPCLIPREPASFRLVCLEVDGFHRLSLVFFQGNPSIVCQEDTYVREMSLFEATLCRGCFKGKPKGNPFWGSPNQATPTFFVIKINHPCVFVSFLVFTSREHTKPTVAWHSSCFHSRHLQKGVPSHS